MAPQHARMTQPQAFLSREAPPGPWLRAEIWLFQRLGAGRGPALGLLLARALARWSWLPLLVLLVQLSLAQRLGLGFALASLLWAGLVQRAGKRLARRWCAQRPFALGLCPNHLGHGGRAGFPSSHALVMGTVFGAALLHTDSAALAAAMGALAVGTGWARVHTGAHFPLDVAAGLGLGLLSGLGLGLVLPG